VKSFADVLQEMNLSLAAKNLAKETVAPMVKQLSL
jgi:hypothetical protein